MNRNVLLVLLAMSLLGNGVLLVLLLGRPDLSLIHISEPTRPY